MADNVIRDSSGAITGIMQGGQVVGIDTIRNQTPAQQSNLPPAASQNVQRPSAPPAQTNVTLTPVTFSHDAGGNVVTKAVVPTVQNQTLTPVTFSHDAHGNVVTKEVAALPTPFISSVKHEAPSQTNVTLTPVTFSHDAGGNVVTKAVVPTVQNPTLTPVTFSHDAHGNVVTKEVAALPTPFVSSIKQEAPTQVKASGVSVTPLSAEGAEAAMNAGLLAKPFVSTIKQETLGQQAVKAAEQNPILAAAASIPIIGAAVKPAEQVAGGIIDVLTGNSQVKSTDIMNQGQSDRLQSVIQAYGAGTDISLSGLSLLANLVNPVTSWKVVVSPESTAVTPFKDLNQKTGLGAPDQEKSAALTEYKNSIVNQQNFAQSYDFDAASKSLASEKAKLELAANPLTESSEALKKEYSDIESLRTGLDTTSPSDVSAFNAKVSAYNVKSSALELSSNELQKQADIYNQNAATFGERISKIQGLNSDVKSTELAAFNIGALEVSNGKLVESSLVERPYGTFSDWSKGASEVELASLGLTRAQVLQGENLYKDDLLGAFVYGAFKEATLNPGNVVASAISGVQFAAVGGAAAETLRFVGAGSSILAPAARTALTIGESIPAKVAMVGGIGALTYAGASKGFTASPSETAMNLGGASVDLAAMGVGAYGMAKGATVVRPTAGALSDVFNSGYERVKSIDVRATADRIASTVVNAPDKLQRFGIETKMDVSQQAFNFKETAKEIGGGVTTTFGLPEVLPNNIRFVHATGLSDVAPFKSKGLAYSGDIGSTTQRLGTSSEWKGNLESYLKSGGRDFYGNNLVFVDLTPEQFASFGTPKFKQSGINIKTPEEIASMQPGERKLYELKTKQNAARADNAIVSNIPDRILNPDFTGGSGVYSGTGQGKFITGPDTFVGMATREQLLGNLPTIGGAKKLRAVSIVSESVQNIRLPTAEDILGPAGPGGVIRSKAVGYDSESGVMSFGGSNPKTGGKSRVLDLGAGNDPVSGATDAVDYGMKGEISSKNVPKTVDYKYGVNYNENLPYPDNTFTKLVSRHSVGSVGNTRPGVFDEMYRVAKPGAQVEIIGPASGELVFANLLRVGFKDVVRTLDTSEAGMMRVGWPDGTFTEVYHPGRTVISGTKPAGTTPQSRVASIISAINVRLPTAEDILGPAGPGGFIRSKAVGYDSESGVMSFGGSNPKTPTVIFEEALQKAGITESTGSITKTPYTPLKSYIPTIDLTDVGLPSGNKIPMEHLPGVKSMLSGEDVIPYEHASAFGKLPATVEQQRVVAEFKRLGGIESEIYGLGESPRTQQFKLARVGTTEGQTAPVAFEPLKLASSGVTDIADIPSTLGLRVEPATPKGLETKYGGAPMSQRMFEQVVTQPAIKSSGVGTSFDEAISKMEIGARVKPAVSEAAQQRILPSATATTFKEPVISKMSLKEMLDVVTDERRPSVTQKQTPSKIETAAPEVVLTQKDAPSTMVTGYEGGTIVRVEPEYAGQPIAYTFDKKGENAMALYETGESGYVPERQWRQDIARSSNTGVMATMRISSPASSLSLSTSSEEASILSGSMASLNTESRLSSVASQRESAVERMVVPDMIIESLKDIIPVSTVRTTQATSQKYDRITMPDAKPERLTTEDLFRLPQSPQSPREIEQPRFEKTGSPEPFTGFPPARGSTGGKIPPLFPGLPSPSGGGGAGGARDPFRKIQREILYIGPRSYGPKRTTKKRKK